MSDKVGKKIDLAALWDNPWPILKQLRNEEPVAWVPAADRYLVTRHEDVTTVEQNPEIYIANERGSLLYRVMGHPFMRKDGEQHKNERQACDRAIKPRAIKNHWADIYRRNTDNLLSGFELKKEADLVEELFGQLSARNLAWMLGFLSEDDDLPDDHFDESLQKWSKAMMDGVANYSDVPEVWAESERASTRIDEHIDRVVDRVSKKPDQSIISHAVNGEYDIEMDALRAAVKVFIGGGINEPRDAMGVSTYALLMDPKLRARVQNDASLWRPVFEEAIRWVAPISMYPKMVAEETTLGGVSLRPGDKIGVCVGSANRDERIFKDPDQFNIDRKVKNHHAFGAGAHFCSGAWAARASVAEMLLPLLFEKFPNMILRPDAEPKSGGWVFRGLLELPVVFDP